MTYVRDFQQCWILNPLTDGTRILTDTVTFLTRESQGNSSSSFFSFIEQFKTHLLFAFNGGDLFQVLGRPIGRKQIRFLLSQNSSSRQGKFKQEKNK